ncbi:DUF1285 domain-containing protein [Pseudoalteromonas sp. S2755]|uniref:DUF1285 domain-containing protein n=1 Tax=Pseudoalteromonas sp. S2755 TaxID=2066523 RepID=UPI00110BBF5A|nr:DUF1285 domain-containing protein [Pseudoalteromonas sp. S2755]TMN45320.1 DUF1285 domain-containing protein [Pseudoalteromonas sp. S2755]
MNKIDALIKLYVTTHAPTENWSAPSCGFSDIKITADGRWFHQGREIKRQSLVALFASVLTFDGQQYWLKTPAESCEIEVLAHPFIIEQWRYCDEASALELSPCIIAIDNLGREWPICDVFPLALEQVNGGDIPFLTLNYGLTARVSQNVYYQWAELLEEDEKGFYLMSAKTRFYLS